MVYRLLFFTIIIPIENIVNRESVYKSILLYLIITWSTINDKNRLVGFDMTDTSLYVLLNIIVLKNRENEK